jgi:MFS family permease
VAPFAVGVALTAPASYPLAQRFGRVTMQIGFAVMAAGLVVLAAMVDGAGDGVSTWTLVPGELLAGMGMGVALPPLFDFILAGVADHEVGSASGLLNAVQQLGSALGIAVLGDHLLRLPRRSPPPGGGDDEHDPAQRRAACARLRGVLAAAPPRPACRISSRRAAGLSTMSA